MTSLAISPSWHRQRWFLAGLALLFAVVFAQFCFKVQGDERSSRSAFKRWQNQIQEMGDGENIWLKHNFPNPPIMALLLYPLAQLPAAWGSLAWFFLKLALTFVVIHWVTSALDRPERPFPLWAKVLAVALALRPISGDLVHGNINLFILFLVAASLVLFCRGRDFASGLVLALSIACKVTPALFVPYFIWKRAWRVVAGCALGLPLFLWVIPGGLLGWQQNHEGFLSWCNVMVTPYIVEGKVWSEHNNQSLPALAMRLLTDSPSFSTYVDDVHYTPVAYHNLVSLPPGMVHVGLKICFALFAFLVYCTCRTPGHERGNWRLWTEFSVIALGMLLFSERTWKHHCVVLLLPFSVAAAALAQHWRERGTRWMLASVLGLAVLCMTLTSTGVSDNHDDFGKMAQVYGAYVWAFALLLAGMTMILQTATQRSTDPIEPSPYQVSFMRVALPDLEQRSETVSASERRSAALSLPESRNSEPSEKTAAL